MRTVNRRLDRGRVGVAEREERERGMAGEVERDVVAAGERVKSVAELRADRRDM